MAYFHVILIHIIPVNGCELVHERSYVAAIFQQCFINYSLRECRLKFLAPPRTSVYTKTIHVGQNTVNLIWFEDL